MGLKSNP